MIKMQVIGHLGKDAVVNNAGGSTVINFSVAHTEKIKDQEKTIWCDCSYWSEKTGIAPYLKKGTQVYVEGSPSIETYTTNDGTTHAKLKLRVFGVQLLGGKTTENPQSNTPAAPQKQQQQPIHQDVPDDLPF
jgi:single-strand DNA-binding protein